MKRETALFTLLVLVLPIPLLAADDSKNMFFPFLPEWVDTLLFILSIFIVPMVVVILFMAMWRKTFSTIWYLISLQPIRRKKLRQQLTNGMEYYRDVPAQGNLKIANIVMNSVSSKWLADYSGLVGALILRLVDANALKMEHKAMMYGTEPHAVLTIAPWPGLQQRMATGVCEDEAVLEQQFHQLLSEAAGHDGVLQPRELQRHLRKHKPEAFIESLKTITDGERKEAQDPTTARQLLGLRKYLLDFSLISERGTNELALWKEYLVYATLFGIADKVCENFATVYPDFFNVNSLAGTRLNIVGNNALVSYVKATVKGIDDGQ